MFIAEDIYQFKNLFVTQLKNMLSADELGAFILVLANSHQDTFLQNELRHALTTTFVALKDNFVAGRLNATQDDSDVFKQLLDVDLEDMPAWRYKTIGNWQVVCNSMRQLRPARTSSQILTTIKQPYDEARFHFNKPFLKPEILWEGLYKELKLRVLYNKFPFSDYHLLVVVSPEKNSPQILTQEVHQYASAMSNDVSNVFPGFGLGFNSLAAGASVNHLHFQGFIRDQGFPIENSVWKHNGGDVDYPLTVKCFTDTDLAWDYMNDLINTDNAFNCLYRKHSCYIIPRKYQGTVALPDWLAGAGWLDVAGVMTVSDETMFDSINEQSVTQALGLLFID
jgi:diadenosine tetraphosphate (Ap4A) HIT family hydrolase